MRGKTETANWGALGTIIALVVLVATGTAYFLTLSQKINSLATSTQVNEMKSNLGGLREKLDNTELKLFSEIEETKNNIIKYFTSINEAQRLMLYNKREEDINKAIYIISDIISGFGDDTPAILYSLLGNAYIKAGEYRKAFANLEIAHKKDQKEGEYLFDMSYCKTAMCLHGEAIDHIEVYLREYDKNDASAYFNLAYNYQILKKYDEANKYYNKSISLDRLNEESAYFNIGVIHALNNDIERAKASVKLSLEKSIQKKNEDEFSAINRICTIEKALVPVDERPPKCHSYLADDLTKLFDDLDFVEWFDEKKISVLGRKKCPKDTLHSLPLVYR